MIVNISQRNDTNNLGDACCSPLHYFAFPEHDYQYISYDAAPHELQLLNSADMVIIGGGGAGWWNDKLSHVLEAIRGPMVVGWGFGCNTHGLTHATYPLHMHKFHMLGIRDWGVPYPWLPCASCAHPALGLQAEPSIPVVVYSHAHCRISLDHAWPMMRNDAVSLYDIVNFMLDADTVVTNTYHGAYWSILLGRKTVIYQPFSSRFHHFKWPVKVVWNPAELQAAIDTAEASPTALLEARASNAEFYQRVRDVYNNGEWRIR